MKLRNLILAIVLCTVLQSCLELTKKDTFLVYGCTDPKAVNYFETATDNDGSCTYLEGCTDSLANNYDPRAGIDDKSCLYTAKYIFYIDGSFVEQGHTLNSLDLFAGNSFNSFAQIKSPSTSDFGNGNCRAIWNNDFSQAIAKNEFRLGTVNTIKVVYNYSYFDSGNQNTQSARREKTFTIEANQSPSYCTFYRIDF